jgi:hypothetical protein
VILSLSEMSSNCLSRNSAHPDALLNVSTILQQRWEHSPKDDRERLELCWGYTDCGDCHRSKGFCGWCPLVSLCNNLARTLHKSRFKYSRYPVTYIALRRNSKNIHIYPCSYFSTSLYTACIHACGRARPATWTAKIHLPAEWSEKSRKLMTL